MSLLKMSPFLLNDLTDKNKFNKYYNNFVHFLTEPNEQGTPVVLPDWWGGAGESTPQPRSNMVIG